MLDHMVALVLVFEKSPYCFPQWLYQFTFPPIVYEGSLFSTSSPTFVICDLFDDSHSDRFLSFQRIVRAKFFFLHKGNSFHILLGEKIVSAYISILNLMTLICLHLFP